MKSNVYLGMHNMNINSQFQELIIICLLSSIRKHNNTFSDIKEVINVTFIACKH